MNWIVLVAIAVITDALRIYIDNYASDYYFKGRGAAAQKLFYGYTSVFFALALALIGGIDPGTLPALFIMVGSGVLSSISGIAYYKALEIENSTNLGIFIQLAPVLYLVLGWAFLGETLTVQQLIAFMVILAAPVLVIATARKRSRHVQLKAVFYAFIYVLIGVIANLIFVKQNCGSEINLLTGIAAVLMGKGLGNFIIILFYPKWRKRFHQVAKSSNRKVYRPLIANAAVGLVKDIAYRWALIAAPSVALASATSDSVEPIVIFFMGLVLTIVKPDFGRESLNRKTVLVHLVAILLVVAGVVLLQF